MLTRQGFSQLAPAQGFTHELDEPLLLSRPVPAPSSVDDVVLPHLALHYLATLAEESLPHQTVEPRIKLARTQSISVMGELFEHPQPVDGLFRCVMKDVELDKIDPESFAIHDNGFR